MRENYSQLLDDVYAQFVNDIADGRGWSPEQTMKIIDNGPYWSAQRARRCSIGSELARQTQ